MLLTYQYRLRLTKEQETTFDQWLELCRRQYNYRLWERFDWWEMHRCSINACPLVCSIAKPKPYPNYYWQQHDLQETKKLFPEYKQIPSHMLQNVLVRVDKAVDRWLKADSTGKRFGRPRFKGKGRYHSLTFPDPIKPEHIKGNRIQLPKIGEVRVIMHRAIPDGFKVKTATVSKKSDGWYISLALEDKTVPVLTPQEAPTMENTVGIDMGLKSFLVTSEGETVDIPKYYRKSEKRLKRLQRQLARKQKGSNRRKKAIKRVAQLHQKVSHQRKDFHYKTVLWLLGKGIFVSHEDLNVKGMAKSMLAKSINDAGWGQFLLILSVKAANAGQGTMAVNPNGTTQNCSGCGAHVPKTLADRWHSCPHCGLEMDRDVNAAKNIKQKAVGHPVSARGGQVNGQPKNREARVA
jgi:putative transposase